MKTTNSNSRRTFLGALALGTVASGLSTISVEGQDRKEDLKGIIPHSKTELLRSIRP